MSDFWTTFLSSPVAITLATAFTGFIIALLTWLTQKIKTWGVNRNKDLWNLSLEIAEMAANAVEQMYSKVTDTTNEERIAMAIKFAKNWGDRNNIKHTEEEWRILIEGVLAGLKDVWGKMKLIEISGTSSEQNTSPPQSP